MLISVIYIYVLICAFLSDDISKKDHFIVILIL